MREQRLHMSRRVYGEQRESLPSTGLFQSSAVLLLIEEIIVDFHIERE